MADQSDAHTIFVDVSTAPEQFPMLFTRAPPKEPPPPAVEVKAENDEENGNLLVELLNQPQRSVTVAPQAKASPSERFRCMECPNRYSAESEEHLLRHIKKVHRGENPFECSMCDYSTYNKSLFEDHVRIHKGIKPFKCSQCPYSSASKKNAKKHELIHRPNNPLKCPLCPFIGRHIRSLNYHRQQHAKATSAEAYNKIRKQRLVQRKQGEIICEHCGTDFAEPRNLASHQRNVKKCEECDAKLCSKYLYKRHMSLTHLKDFGDDASASFKCALCPWKGSQKPRVLLHLIHHPGQSVDESVFDVSILRNFGIMQ